VEEAAVLALLEALIPVAGWAAATGACAFLLFVGAALAVTLFHPRPERRRHAARVLRQLLTFLRSDR
jgi:hypothetical protein